MDMGASARAGPHGSPPRRAGAGAAAGAVRLAGLCLGLLLHTAAAAASPAFVQHQQQQPPQRRGGPSHLHQHRRPATTILLPFGAAGSGPSSLAWPPADPPSSSSSAATRLYAAAGNGAGAGGSKKKGGGGLRGLLTAVPRFVGGKLLDAQDSVYVKRALYLPPGNGTVPAAEAEAVVVVFPGIGMGPKAYAGLALALQQALAANYDIQAYVVVAKFFNNLGYLPQEPERRLNSILAELGSQGVSPRAPLGVVGHSGGAFLAYDAALTRSQAFVHVGSTLNSRGALPWTPRSVVEYPKPVLQLLGEMDGYIRFTGGALEFGEVEKLMGRKGFEDAVLEKPVVVIPGVSHQQFADGSQSRLARASGRRDLSPYVPLEEAWKLTAKIVAAFLAVHLCPQKPKAPQGASILRQAFEATGRMVRPYLAELEPVAEEDFIRWAQVEVASVEGVGKNSVRCAMYTTEPEFIYSKPLIDQTPDFDYLQVAVRRQPEAGIKTGFTRQIAPALALKMKRQEAVVQALQRFPSKRSPTAAELNKRTFDKALERVSEEARRRYERYGRKLEFVQDDEITAERGGGPAWVAAPLEVRPRPEDPMRVTVRSPVLYTPLDAPPRFAGMCYMKLLTPAQAMEWILHDAYILGGAGNGGAFGGAGR